MRAEMLNLYFFLPMFAPNPELRYADKPLFLAQAFAQQEFLCAPSFARYCIRSGINRIIIFVKSGTTSAAVRNLGTSEA